MSFLLPKSTIDMERSRLAETTSTFEFLQCFAGTFEIRNLCGDSILRLTDAPLFRLARDLVEGLRTIVRAKSTVTIFDFYGEFELEIVRVGQQEICIRKLGTEENVRASFSDLADSLHAALSLFLASIDTLFPIAAENADYKELRCQLKTPIEVAN